MTFEGAVVREQGVVFAIIVVKMHVIQSSFEANRVINNFGAQAFPGIPVVLMAQDSRRTPTYYGRPDIVRFLAGVSVNPIPWERYTLS